tara:strand:+ start:1054 stop:1431 length:378 start_codon:yes stop_codon:yes gene_type:complete
MSTEETKIVQGLKRIAYLRKERMIVFTLSILSMFGTFFLMQPVSGDNEISPVVAALVTIVGAGIFFNTIRFAIAKCPRCGKSFNGYTYLLGIRRGNALECTNCQLSLTALPEFKPTYKQGGADQW